MAREAFVLCGGRPAAYSFFFQTPMKYPVGIACPRSSFQGTLGTQCNACSWFSFFFVWYTEPGNSGLNVFTNTETGRTFYVRGDFLSGHLRTGACVCGVFPVLRSVGQNVGMIKRWTIDWICYSVVSLWMGRCGLGKKDKPETALDGGLYLPPPKLNSALYFILGSAIVSRQG